MKKYKRVSELKAGDVVKAHGGLFLITESARESRAHRPRAGHLVTAHGPSYCAVAIAKCLEGCVEGYFEPGRAWRFQGNGNVSYEVA